MTEGPYCRVYWTVMSDEKFDGIRENPTHLGAWLTLLLAADMAYPAPAFLPAHLSKRLVSLIESRDLIQVLPGWRYRVTGLDAERSSRSAAARVGGLASGRSRSVERPLNDRSQHQRTETNLAEQSKAKTEHSARAREGLQHITDAVAEAFQRATGRPFLAAGAFALEYLESACERHPEADVVAAIGWARQQFQTGPTSQQLAVMVRGRLDPLPDTKAAAKADSERREQDASRRRIQATKARIHDQGSHADEPDPMCDRCRGAA